MENFLSKTLKNKKNKKKFTSLKCHPKNKSFKKSSCLDLDTLVMLKQFWNKRHPDHQIRTRKKENIWNEIKKKMSDSCNHEMCWIDSVIPSNAKKEKLKNELFVPKMPDSWKANPTEWLSSIEISDVLKQYEEKYDDFVFLGPSPIDFDSANIVDTNNRDMCVWPELCNFDLKKHMSNNVKKVGMVFNLDKHYQDGSHWVSMFLDIPSKKLFYFDSAGSGPPKEIKNLCEKIKAQAKRMNITLNIDDNKDIQHQIHNTECGMYSLYFIISLLTKKHNIDYFKKKIIRDNLVKQFRTIYFNKI
jgi:hypothetical protein